MHVADALVARIIAAQKSEVPTTMTGIQGERQLAISTAPKGSFRSAPLFLAIPEAHETLESHYFSKADLFLKLHELTSCKPVRGECVRLAGWHKHVRTRNCNQITSTVSLMVNPILYWTKLLLTIGGCVVTAAELANEEFFGNHGYNTTERPVPGFSGLVEWISSAAVTCRRSMGVAAADHGQEATFH